jgi:tetratricopeptide (TPR) repeat protein
MVRRNSQEECMVRRNGRPIWRLMLAAVAALTIAMPVAAQMGGMVKGTVVDDKNQPVEGAKITISMADTGRKFETKTDKKGQYLQIGLASGAYVVVAEKNKLASAPQKATIRAGSPAELNLVIGVAADALTKEGLAKAGALRSAFESGVALSQAGKHEEAIAKFNEGIAASPQCVDCYNNIGYSYTQMKDYDKAEAAYKKATELKPQDAAAYNGLANIYNAQRKFDLAAQASAKATELSTSLSAPGGAGGGTGGADALFNQGVILWNGGKVAEAKKAFEGAIAANPSHAEAHYQLGMALVNEGNMQGAASEFDTYLKLAPTGPNAATAKSLVAQLKK